MSVVERTVGVPVSVVAVSLTEPTGPRLSKAVDGAAQAFFG